MIDATKPTPLIINKNYRLAIKAIEELQDATTRDARIDAINEAIHQLTALSAFLPNFRDAPRGPVPE